VRRGARPLAQLECAKLTVPCGLAAVRRTMVNRSFDPSLPVRTSAWVNVSMSVFLRDVFTVSKGEMAAVGGKPRVGRDERIGSLDGDGEVEAAARELGRVHPLARTSWPAAGQRPVGRGFLPRLAYRLLVASRICSSSCAASSISLCRHSAAR
jgi:hypothetical protein